MRHCVKRSSVISLEKKCRQTTLGKIWWQGWNFVQLGALRVGLLEYRYTSFLLSWRAQFLANTFFYEIPTLVQNSIRYLLWIAFLATICVTSSSLYKKYRYYICTNHCKLSFHIMPSRKTSSKLIHCITLFIRVINSFVRILPCRDTASPTYFGIRFLASDLRAIISIGMGKLSFVNCLHYRSTLKFVWTWRVSIFQFSQEMHHSNQVRVYQFLLPYQYHLPSVQKFVLT